MQHQYVPANAEVLSNDLSYEIGEVRALAEALNYIDMNDDEVFKRASPYLIRILSERADELDKKYCDLTGSVRVAA